MAKGIVKLMTFLGENPVSLILLSIVLYMYCIALYWKFQIMTNE